jgi:hypothetical protein
VTRISLPIASLRSDSMFGILSAFITGMRRVLGPYSQILHNAVTAAGVTKKSRRFMNLLSVLIIFFVLSDKASSGIFPEHEISERTDFREFMSTGLC